MKNTLLVCLTAILTEILLLVCVNTLVNKEIDVQASSIQINAMRDAAYFRLNTMKFQAELAKQQKGPIVEIPTETPTPTPTPAPQGIKISLRS